MSGAGAFDADADVGVISQELGKETLGWVGWPCSEKARAVMLIWLKTA